MIIEKSLGIWMDHQNAHVMEFTTDPIETTTVESQFTHQEKEQTLHRGENLMHTKSSMKKLIIIKNWERSSEIIMMWYFSGQLKQKLNCTIFSKRSSFR
jgi:hypothetical protein